MRTDDFDYNLPDQLIAQMPLAKRDACRLLYLSKKSAEIEHRTFRDLKNILRKGDRLVFNNTRVIPARLFGMKGNGVPVEFLFTEAVDDNTWKTIAKPAKRLKVGTIVSINNCAECQLEITGVLDDGTRIVKIVNNDNGFTFDRIFETYGHIPLPQYITREDTGADRQEYQTVFAEKKGAIAAPTAGLHFTQQLIDELKDDGIDVSFVTLHVGIGTFRPVKVDDPRQHDMHVEAYELSSEAANEINQTKCSGGRIIAVGTTVVRVLEHCASENGGVLNESRGKTKILILPPYQFKAIDGLITNFHLPKSTLLMLVSALGGFYPVMNAYRAAVDEQYRFYSYGDAMIII
jgi:S-adenosylmethionine:tRNA ribosyltransferase-isomerase